MHIQDMSQTQSSSLEGGLIFVNQSSAFKEHVFQTSCYFNFLLVLIKHNASTF